MRGHIDGKGGREEELSKRLYLELKVSPTNLVVLHSSFKSYTGGPGGGTMLRRLIFCSSVDESTLHSGRESYKSVLCPD